MSKTKADSEYADAPSTRDVSLPSEARLDRLTRALHDDKTAREYLYLVQERHLSPKTLRWCGVGWDAAAEAYVWPLRDEKGKLVNVKWYRPAWSSRLENKGRKDMWVVADRPTLLLWPTYDFQDKTQVLITEGEMDTMYAITLGFPAVTSTGGAGKWDYGWGHLFEGLEVVIVPDLDPDGRRHMQIVSQSVSDFAKSVRALRWSDLV